MNYDDYINGFEEFLNDQWLNWNNWANEDMYEDYDEYLIEQWYED